MEVQQDKPFIIAYYLPQYHPIPENDEWWGKGFTEWTNVAKAQPLFKGHYQPKIPADLGFYDLRVPEVREQQAELAREAGVDGFCYWHYWFGNGKELLERPFKEVVESGKPDFPFCLGWANESWYAKIWNSDAVCSKKMLIEQTYPEDTEQHFYACLKAFRDSRYIRHNGKPIFLIYKPDQHPGMSLFIKKWNSLVKKEGVGEKFYFIGVCEDSTIEETLKKGFDSVITMPFSRYEKAYKKQNIIIRAFKYAFRTILKKPLLISYPKGMEYMWDPEIDSKEHVIPTLFPNWDHSPRSLRAASILTNSTPEEFEKHCERTLKGVAKKENKLVILKSWNEWGEGNYMEPDLKYGKGYIHALASAIKTVFH
ncbi:MAG: glycoside hydrolase family 99-like domain-containing protein [Bacteroidales bacterium]|nr:glycoside hydrolase family 99-like domain-containing protein [Bacteroidales bacterium]